MNKSKFVWLLALAGVIFSLVMATSTALADWYPGDPYKMHFPQLPDEAGWDVNATQPVVLADDWGCIESGWVKDIHFWGSWMEGFTGEITSFVLSIHDNVPGPPSTPGQTLWEWEVPFDSVIAVPFTSPEWEGWYDPPSGMWAPSDHNTYYQYNVFLPEAEWFWQEEGTIYWLNISAIVADQPGGQWGWKSSIQHFEDDACWAFWGELNWIDIWEPPDFIQSLDLAFVITGGVELDYGDCPDPTYPTLLASDGARHIIAPGVFLGASIDPETDGQPSADALGDDNNPPIGPDDEDGVVFTSLVIQGQPATVKVTASVAGSLDAWIDFNGDGNWADAGEQIFNTTPLVAGVNNLNFTVPTVAQVGTTYSRFRFSTAGGLSYTGQASDGEVEDYTVDIEEKPEPGIGWWFKSCYPDYAPSGMPDFDQKQDSWDYPTGSGNWTYCGPTAVANCFWWVDSRFEAFFGPGGGIPGDGADTFPLVRDYNEPPPVDPTQPLPNTDDHGFENVDDLQTPPPPIAGPPPPLPPFPGLPVTGAELVERLAWYMNTDGMQTGFDHQGTYQIDMGMGIDQWIYEQELDTLLYEHTEEMPTFAWIDTQVHKSQDVILLLGFWWFDGETWWRHGGHYVTVAGVNSQQWMLAFSDPFLDLAEAGFAGCIHNSAYKPHNHGIYGPQTHNDAGNASHDWHLIMSDSPSPGGVIWIPEYPFTYMDLIYYFMNKNYRDPGDMQFFQEWNQMEPIHTEIECAVVVSPWPDWHDAPAPYDSAHHSNWTEEWLGESVSADMAPRLVDRDTYDDGVQFFDYKQGQAGSLKVTISVRDRDGSTCPGHGPRYDPYHLLYLHGWIDWNGDGIWDNLNENIFCGLTFDPSTWTSNSFIYTSIFDVPGDAAIGTTWARFRLDYNQNRNEPAGQAFCGEVEDYHNEVIVVSVPGERGDLRVPQTFELAQNYPNPFNLETAIRYQIPENCYVTLEIYNLLGQKVRTLVSADQKANFYTTYWNGKDAEGKEISSGIYFYTLKAGNFTQTRKMVILK